MIGVPAGELAQTVESFAARIHPEDVDPTLAHLADHLEGRRDRIDVEYRIRMGGGFGWLRTRGNTVERDAGGRPVRVAGVVTDIGARKAAQQELERTLAQNQALVSELQEALRKVKTLQGLVPICAWCKKIRNDAGFWEQLEAYLADHTSAEFTHGICPECFAKESE
jgi:PAS domain-containing protein